MLASLVTLIFVFLQFIVVMYVLFLFTKMSDSLETISQTLLRINEQLFVLTGVGKRENVENESQAMIPDDLNKK